MFCNYKCLCNFTSTKTKHYVTYNSKSPKRHEANTGKGIYLSICGSTNRGYSLTINRGFTFEFEGVRG